MTGVAMPPLGRHGEPPTREQQERALLTAERTLQAEGMLAVSLPVGGLDSVTGGFLTELLRRMPATLLAVYGTRGAATTSPPAAAHLSAIYVGAPLAQGTPITAAAEALERLRAGESSSAA
jgi:hypothetical protein